MLFSQTNSFSNVVSNRFKIYGWDFFKLGKCLILYFDIYLDINLNFYVLKFIILLKIIASYNYATWIMFQELHKVIGVKGCLKYDFLFTKI